MKFPFKRKTKAKLEYPTDGVLIGHSENGSRTPFYVAAGALRHHSLVIGKTASDRINLIKLLTSAAMERDWSLVVIDTDGDLVLSLLDLVPPRRADVVSYFDLSNGEQVVGLNLLDVSTGLPSYCIVDSILRASELLWNDEWGAFQEDVLRMSLHSLLHANRVLAQRNEDQLTLVDFPQLFDLPSFRHQLLQGYVADTEIIQWWLAYYEQVHQQLKADAVLPLSARIRAMARNPLLRNILGQPKMTINFREVSSDRRITLINLAQTALPPETWEWLVLVLTDLLTSAMLARNTTGDQPNRGNTVVVFHGFQPVSVLDQITTLSDLRRRGVSCIFSEQSLSGLETIKPSLVNALMTSLTNLFVFRAGCVTPRSCPANCAPSCRSLI